jgi:hypothetical protein
MTRSRLTELVLALAEATPAPPTSTLDPAALATLTTAILEKRQPLIVALGEAIAAGAVLDPDSRQRLSAVTEIDAAWRQLLEVARTALGRQLVSVSRQEARESAAEAAPAPPLLDIRA